MIVPSHFTPLAAPGMVALGLKWMWNPESPFYIKPRLDLDLLSWGFKFWRAATADHVRRAAPLLRDLHLASRAGYEEFAALPDTDFGLVQKGLVMLCRTQHALDEEAAAAQQARALGVPADVLDARQTAALDPNVTMTVAGSVYFPKDCHLSPDRFMAALKQQCDRLDVKFIWNTEVAGWKLENRRIVSVQVKTAGAPEIIRRERDGNTKSRVGPLRSDTNEITADEFVLCGGSWSPVISRDLGLTLPMQAGKGYSLTLTQPRQLPQICSIFTEARVAVTPMIGTLRFGGTMEMAGLNEDINPVRVRGIIKSVPHYYPQFREEDFAEVRPWRGLRPCSPDGLPYLGRTRRASNLVIATGHAMMGLSLGPITGRLVAELITDGKPSLALDLLNPDRY